jgi:hypothetical protein
MKSLWRPSNLVPVLSLACLFATSGWPEVKLLAGCAFPR